MTSVAARSLGLGGMLTDGAQLVGLVFLIPFVILAIGIPVALVIAGLLWLARIVGAAL
jgi:hypothetical protein